MSNSAVVFPGQGAQRRGMAMDFLAELPESREAFAQAAAVLPFDPIALCTDEDPRLDQTEYAQPCILTAEIAMLWGLRARFGFRPEWFGGHSLGEYSALVAADVMPLPTAVRLVHARGRLMQHAAPLGFGAMAALVADPLPIEDIRTLAAKHGVDLANDNSRAQVVVSGEKTSVDALCADLDERFPADALRIVPLTVSAPFHSRHMAQVEAEFRKVLQAVRGDFDAAKATRVTSNFTGQFHTGRLDDLVDGLTRQISAPVLWRDDMVTLAGQASAVFEVGPGRPLAGFFKTQFSDRTDKAVTVASILDLRSAQRAFAAKEGA